jgi:uncharacterized membrane protein
LTFGLNAGIIPSIASQSEVTDINKQKFLPELGRLLTFMAEEDRQTALAMYNRLFDDAEDEQHVLSLLESPTRQAVLIARAYDPKERKRQQEAAARGEEQTPGFVLAIDRLYQQIAPKRPAAPEPEIAQEEAPAVVNQFSLFEDDAHPIDDNEYVPFQIEADAVPIPESVEQLPVEAESAPAEEPAPAEEAAEQAEPAPAEEDLTERVFAAAPVTPEEERSFSAPAEEAPLAPVSVPQPAPVPAPEPAPVPAEEPAPAPEQELDLDYIPETRRKAKGFLLFLYVLLAVPVTLAATVLLLIPTVLVLALSLLIIVAGSAVLVAAFSGFPKLADILIVVGTSVIVLALGLLLLWLFVWFVGGAIGGLIRNVIELGRKWCYEEVPV